jgi:hypothetical protein
MVFCRRLKTWQRLTKRLQLLAGHQFLWQAFQALRLTAWRFSLRLLRLVCSLRLIDRLDPPQ